MDQVPDTRASLLVRLSDLQDQQAWCEFAEIYGPLIYRLARRKGLQHADADELTQDALLAVVSAIGRWQAAPHRGAFRGWLFRIARNLAINFLTRPTPAGRAIGGSGFHEMLQQEPAPTGEESVLFTTEYRREVFRWAAQRVRTEFHESTWQAFWQTYMEGRDIRQTAEELGLSVGAAYTARSRIIARIREQAQRFEQD